MTKEDEYLETIIEQSATTIITLGLTLTALGENLIRVVKLRQDGRRRFGDDREAGL